MPAISLCAYGFFTPTLVGSLCFGAGLGITVFGMGYMFIHDGLGECSWLAVCALPRANMGRGGLGCY